jgi:hypothetical protein
MDKEFEIIRQDGDDLITSCDGGIIMRVVTPAQRATRERAEGELPTFSGNSVSVIISDLQLPETLFPGTVIYDFLILDTDWIKQASAIAQVRDAIEYYCTTRLKAGREQLQILDLYSLEAFFDECIGEAAEKARYDFKYFEGGDRKVIYLPDGSFKMKVEERELADGESGPILTATLFQPFVDAGPLRFHYDDWEINARYVFTIQECAQEINGFMRV